MADRGFSLNTRPVTSDELDNIERYLTATRSALLFANGVLLAEGDVEEILLQGFARAMGFNFDHLSIIVCNVAGINFKPYVKLAASLGLPFSSSLTGIHWIERSNPWAKHVL